MLLIYWQQIVGTCCLGTLVIWVMAAYANFVNKRLPDGHEEKQSFHPYAWLAVPFTIPLFLILYIIALLVYAILFGILLVLLPISFLVFRKPFLLKWLKEKAILVGNFFLKINTWLLKYFWPLPLPTPVS